MERQETESAPVFRRRFNVVDSDVDVWNHTNNVCYVRWMQDVAVAHSEELGWNSERYLAEGAIWVVRSHHVDYLRSTFCGDRLLAQTWIAEMKRASCIRRYRFYKLPDEINDEAAEKICGLADSLNDPIFDSCELSVEAETHWAFVSSKTFRPVKVFPELVAFFKEANSERI